MPTLRKLYLASNKLTKLEGLDGLSQLTILHLRENKIDSLDGLPQTLESLQYVNLRYSSGVYIHYDSKKFMLEA